MTTLETKNGISTLRNKAFNETPQNNQFKK